MPSLFRPRLRWRIQDLALTYSFRGPRKQESKNNYNSTILGAKNKMSSNFLWEKIIEFLLFIEILENLIFFPIADHKLIYSKRFEFMVYTFIFSFW